MPSKYTTDGPSATVEKSSSPAWAIPLSKIKNPALLIDLNGKICRTNEEARTWLHKRKFEEIDIFRLFPSIATELSVILQTPEEQRFSLTIDKDGNQFSLIWTHFDQKAALLLNIVVKNADWVEKRHKKVQSALKLDRISRDLKEGPLTPATGLNADEKIYAVLGQLARLAYFHPWETFKQKLPEWIAIGLDLEVVFVEWVGQDLDSVGVQAKHQFGRQDKISQFMNVYNWVLSLVLNENKPVLLSESEIDEILSTDLEVKLEESTGSIAVVPITNGIEVIAIIGLQSKVSSSQNEVLEFWGMSLSKLLGTIFSHFDEYRSRSMAEKKFQTLLQRYPFPCWVSDAKHNLRSFNIAFLDAKIQKSSTTFKPELLPSEEALKMPESSFAFQDDSLTTQTVSVFDDSGNLESEIGIAFPSNTESAANPGLIGHLLNWIDTQNDLRFQLSADGSVLDGNAQSLALFRPTGQPSNLTDFVVTDEADNLMVRLQSSTTFPVHIDLPIKDISGDIREFSCSIFKLDPTKEGATTFLVMGREITHLKEALQNEIRLKSEASQALRIKERFLANVSHEIRTPLNGIMGMAHLLRDTGLSSFQSEYVEIIQRSGEALLHVLNQLIDLSATDTGKISIKPGPVNVAHMIQGIVRLYQDQAKLKNIYFQADIQEDMPLLLADESRLCQAIHHLLSNAFKFTIQGKVELKISLKSDHSGTSLIIEVSDTGCGLSGTEQEAIRQLMQSDNPEYAFLASKGGLGLLTLRLICDAMQGIFGFVSAPGTGSTFWLHIPVQKAELHGFKPIHTQTPAFWFEHEFPDVLLVDDNAVNLKVANEILKKAGCHVCIATNGEEAIDMAKKHRFHVILMDIQMPVMDGITATIHLKNLDLGYNPAIVAMTAYCLKEDKIKFVEAGMDDFIAKPISAEKILSKVKYWMEKNKSLHASGPETELPAQKFETRSDQLAKVFDFAVLKNLLKHLGDDILLASVQEFATETQTILEEMQEAVGKKDWEILARHAHTLKGNAGTFGVNKLSMVAKELEIEMKKGNIAASTDLLNQIQTEAGRFLECQPLLYNSHEWKN